jgi:hypothetical protein
MLRPLAIEGIGLGLLLVATNSQGDPPSRFLQAPTGQLTYEFSEITSVYELPDGRVVILDRSDAAVYIGDFRSSRVAQIGRRGSGPGEYRAPSNLYPMGGDSVAIFDDNLMRLLMVTDRGALGGHASPLPPSLLGAAEVWSDHEGWFYGQGLSPQSDSSPLYRWQIGGPAMRIGFLPTSRPRGTMASPSRTIAPGIFSAPSTRNRWTVSSVGRVAIVEYEPYRVRFLESSGEQHVGKPIPYVRQPVNDSIKRAYLDEVVPRASGMVVDKTGAPAGAASGRSGRRVPSSWASEVPPFRGDAFIAFDPRGRLWIQRATFGREGARYDVIDDLGNLQASAKLDSGHTIAGFGRRDVYVARRNADDLMQLQRRPLPR